jgi:hypothetical protein
VSWSSVLRWWLLFEQRKLCRATGRASPCDRLLFECTKEKSVRDFGLKLRIEDNGGDGALWPGRRWRRGFYWWWWQGGLGELGFGIVTGQHLAPTIEGFRGEVVGGRGTRGRGGANGRRMRR